MRIALIGPQPIEIISLPTVDAQDGNGVSSMDQTLCGRLSSLPHKPRPNKNLLSYPSGFDRSILNVYQQLTA